MSERKRSRVPYSELSREEKDKINARKRALRWEKMQQTHALVPVHVQEAQTSTNFIDQNFSAQSSMQTNITTQTTCDEPTFLQTDQTDSLDQQFSNARDELCVLYDVPIGTAPGLLMPPPSLNQRRIPTEPYTLPEQPSCIYCGAKKFPYESVHFCCCKGEVDLCPITIPDEFRHLYSRLTPESIHFLKYIKPYNEAFAFTSFGVHLDPQFAKRVNGVYTFRAQGQIYHYINGLLPATKVPSIFQVYFYDTEHEIDHRKGSKDKLETSMIEALIVMLHGNPYSRFFRSLTEVPNLQDCQIRLKANPKLEYRTAAPPVVSQVAAIWNEDEDADQIAEREIIVQKHDGHSQRIQYYYGCYDPLQYPLLFPQGEPGWHRGIKKKKTNNHSAQSSTQPAVIATNASTAEELIAIEATAYQPTGNENNMVSAREFYAYRLQIRPSTNSILLESGRLLQQFVVDMYVKIETSRLDYFRSKQDEIRADLYQGIVDSVGQGETEGSKVGTRIILPRTFIGGPRDMQKRYLDAMTLVKKYGKPDLFITMTCNPNWPEIKKELKPHEEAQNRPDLLTRIFRSKFEQLRKELHLEGCQSVSFKDNTNLDNIADNDFYSRTMLTQFFWMNAHDDDAKAAKLLYEDFPTQFTWNSQTRMWRLRQRNEVIGRIVAANPNEEERYYVRLLLTHVPAPTSYDYLRTVNGTLLSSNREASIALGLLEDDDSNEKCMEEACIYRMPTSLRQLFCTILLYCSPTSPENLFLKFEEDMAQDYVSIQNMTKDAARQKLLNTINSELQSSGKSLAHFQLSHLVTQQAKKKSSCREIEDEMNLPVSEADIAAVGLLNQEQKSAYDQILQSVFNSIPQSFFIDGPGGTGKTFLYRSILATIRSQGKIALATASSGIAASILPNGRTAHSRFKIPIDAEGKLYCNIGKQSGTMPPNILTLEQLGPLTKNYTVLVMITEKGLARPASGPSSGYQRLLLQDAQGNKMQAIIYGDNINIFEKTLKLYQTYAITNALVTKIKDQFRFLPKTHQLVISAKSPVEEIKIDGFTVRSLQYNFTPLSDLNAAQGNDAQIDVLFAVLNVGPRRKPKNSYVVDLQVIDSSMVPTTISLWHQFSEYEAAEFRKLKGPFPIAIGLRLKHSTYYGGSLATHGPSTFIFNPNIPQVAELNKWCLANVEKISNLPPVTPANLRRAIQKQPADDDIITIINLPTSVTEPEYPSIKGIIRVTDFNQNFYYLSCSECNRATNAYDDDNFWCNYCNLKVPPLPRIKFNVEITDETGSITATIFAEKAEQLYNITPTEMVNNTGDVNLPIEIIEKLSAPKECTIILRAYMYTYGALSQCVFNIHAIFNSVADQQALQEPPLQLLGPNTPKKRVTKATSSMQSPTNDDDMEEDQDIQPLKTKHKKE